MDPDSELLEELLIRDSMETFITTNIADEGLFLPTLNASMAAMHHREATPPPIELPPEMPMIEFHVPLS